MTRPLVSVVVPVYNGERFLAEALDSVLAQEYEPLEVVVVDDGSTDASAEIVRRYPVRLIRQENAGVAAARNAGIAASSGAFLALLDQDDVWLPGKVGRQVDYLTAHEEAGFVHAWVDILLEPGTPVPPWLDAAYLEGAHFRPLPSELLIRREALETVGPFDETFVIGSDGDWLARALDAGVLGGVVEEGLVRWRVHDRNETHRGATTLTDLARALKRSAARKRAAATVSVIAPAFDAEPYLAEALESALAQTAPPHEVVVVDDGSTDRTAEVAARFAPRVVCVSQENQGSGPARNRGVALATGDFFAFLDADDVWEPEKLELQLAAFAADPGLELVFGHVREFVSPDLDPAAAARVSPRTEPTPGHLVGTMIARRGAFARVGPFPSDRLVSETLDWLLRARELNVREATIPECVVRRRLHAGNHWLRNQQQKHELAVTLKASLDRRRGRGGSAT